MKLVSIKKHTKRYLNLLNRVSVSLFPFIKRNSKPLKFAPLKNEEITTLKRWGVDYYFKYRIENLKFIHIGKCGGTTIKKRFMTAGIRLSHYHRQKPIANPNFGYFVWIRNPFTRFVSAFNHTHSIVNFDINNCDPENLTLENCPAPALVLRRLETGLIFEKSFEDLISSFNSANELAESLSSSNRKIREKAHQLMNHEEQHLNKSIGWYLDNGRFVEQNKKQIIFVGRLEHMRNDFEILMNRLELNDYFKNSITQKTRIGEMSYSTELSETAINNIRKFYSETDFKTLDILHKNGFINKETYDRYQIYKAS
ncbi:MAG: sulfotransferase family 2 domain-containing protein [Melioribacteraceae bacterium]|nr:sulfotransferase family 2 domain-containing protein [Melioribacteraceae bacterium]MCF8264417.1 sulfotransferase family 2 domain-containing protein [Melioribacteraceae bacterium]MCF8432469.1 sulfotransferase family 2 domain-containing protein [Melioribacteraceae bacterium]